MLHKHKKLLEDFGATALVGATGLATGIVVGMGFQKLINKFKNKYTSCRAIEDPYMRDKCTVGVLQSMIDHMRNVSKRECGQTPDPAECQLKILQKIDKLMEKKRRLENHLYRQDRSDIIDNRSS